MERVKIIISIVLLFSLFGCRDMRKEYYENGNLESEFEYKNDKLNGVGKTYYENGELKSQGQYIDGKKEGVFTFYFRKGKLKMKVNYINGKEEGVIKKYYKNGALNVEAEFKNGKQDGITKEYFESGKPKGLINYKNGVRHGEYKSYHTNGQLSMEAFCINGKTVYYKEYDELGKLTNHYRVPPIPTLPDTAYVGKTYPLSIDFKGPSLEIAEIGIKIILKDEKGELLKADTAIFVSEELNCNYTPKVPGNYLINGYIRDVDSTLYFIDKDFVVLPRKSS